MMHQLGAEVTEELTKIFRNKSDILEEILNELLDLETPEIYSFSRDFKNYIGMVLDMYK